MDELKKKKEGFQGQKAIVIPRTVLHKKCAGHAVIGQLYITDIGYYPKARFHYRERPHGADQHILIYCQEGRGSVQIGKTSYAVEAGEFIAIPGKTRHSYAAAEDNPWTIYWIHFRGAVSNQLVSRFKELYGWKGFTPSGEKSIELFNEIYQQLERGYGSDTLMHANMCLWHYISTFLHNDSLPTENAKNKTAIDMAIDFLGKNITRAVTLSEVAKVVHLSPAHFSSVFRKKTGFSPIEYFNHLKIQKACQHLLFTDLRVKEIAQLIGIDDPYYFSRLFTKLMGISPNEYREKRHQ
jgi:AraC-like DNA-binding protein